MPRFIDDLRAGHPVTRPLIAPGWEKEWVAKHNRILTAALGDKHLPVILINNVADYLGKHGNPGKGDLAKDFPNLAPPFPKFWMEYRVPEIIQAKFDKRVPDAAARRTAEMRIGWFAEALSPTSAQLLPEFRRGPAPPEGTHWVLALDYFVDYGMRGPYAGPHTALIFTTGADGTPLSCVAADDPGDVELAQYWADPALLAISFLHCKNVTLVKNKVPAALEKKQERKLGIKPTAYHTLVIEPLKEILRTQGHLQKTGLTQAMHICRGHFRDYREGRGLFGKYHQLVWTPSVVRGTKKNDNEPPPREIEVKV